MASLNMQGSYPLTRDRIDEIIAKTSAGSYALGYVNEEKIFIVQYVGRADADVASHLEQHIGEKFKQFKYSYATSPKAVFVKECYNYHDFGKSKSLDNEIHPDKPANTTGNARAVTFLTKGYLTCQEKNITLSPTPMVVGM